MTFITKQKFYNHISPFYVATIVTLMVYKASAYLHNIVPSYELATVLQVLDVLGILNISIDPFPLEWEHGMALHTKEKSLEYPIPKYMYALC